MSVVGRRVIRLADDSDCPAAATVLGYVNSEWVQVIWDGDDEPVLEPFDDLILWRTPSQFGRMP